MAFDREQNEHRNHQMLDSASAVRRMFSAEDEARARPARDPDIVAYQYWNTNGGAIAAVAVKSALVHTQECAVRKQGECDCSGTPAWCAYICATPHCQYEEDAENFARRHGDKLRREWALAMFPELAEQPWMEE